MSYSIVRRYRRVSLGFGITVAVIFRIIAPVFVEFRSDMHMWIFTALCFAAGIAVGLSSYLIGKRLILRMFDRLAEYSRETASGNFSATLDLKSDDVIGETFANFNRSAESVQDALRVLQQLVYTVVYAMKDQAAAAASLSGNAILQAEMEDTVAVSSRQNTMNIEEISANVDVLTNTYDVMLARMHALSKSVHAADAESVKALERAAAISDSTRRGDGALSSAGETISRIEKSSVEMTEIMTIINDIADRINLLSLNASIESARAGAAGRGFAVVAEEISKLADQTASSISHIDSLIKNNRGEIAAGMSSVNEAIETMRTIVRHTEEITESVGSMRRSMEDQMAYEADVDREAKSVGAMTADINQIIGMYAVASKEIDDSIQKSGQICNDNASAAEELSASVEEINATVKKLADRMSFFRL